METTALLPLIDYHPSSNSFREDVVEGLGKTQKQLSPKYFYDERGSTLFDEITRLDEYYPTRTEAAIMRDHVDEMAEAIGPNAALVEYGSGSSEKTRILLDRLASELAGYIPVDISREHLVNAAQSIADTYPDLVVQPVCADYTSPFSLPDLAEDAERTVIYFPGSTIGNFNRGEATDFLRQMAEMAGPGGGLLIGVDLKKDPTILHAAYNDREGVTAEFNLNLLRRINRELGGDFDVSAFRHEAVWRPSPGRMEMHLVSKRKQEVHIGEHTFSFEDGETIHTENSCKFSLDEFRRMARDAGFDIRSVWTDNNSLFSVQYADVR
jgi:dimethylhistidine N-methyltransferase